MQGFVRSEIVKHIIPPAFVAIVVVGLSGCGQGPKSGKGFTLPEGDAARGQETFVALQCHACHSVSEVELPDIEPELKPQVRLGGEVDRISTYGELVTSIINPSHKLAKGYNPEDVATGGESKMANYNEAMTVQQLIDLTAFLQAHYKLKPYQPSDYPMYY
jgi:L-cysteine S-thiosulfotransferase